MCKKKQVLHFYLFLLISINIRRYFTVSNIFEVRPGPYALSTRTVGSLHPFSSIHIVSKKFIKYYRIRCLRELCFDTWGL